MLISLQKCPELAGGLQYDILGTLNFVGVVLVNSKLLLLKTIAVDNIKYSECLKSVWNSKFLRPFEDVKPVVYSTFKGKQHSVHCMYDWLAKKLPWKNRMRWTSLPPSNFAQWKSGVQKIWKFLGGTVTLIPGLNFQYCYIHFQICSGKLFKLIITVHKINKTEKTQVKMLWTEFKSADKLDRCFNSQFATAHEQRD
jgi:hypothetical protein